MKSNAFTKAKSMLSNQAKKRVTSLKKERSKKLRSANKAGLKKQGEDFVEVRSWTGERDLI